MYPLTQVVASVSFLGYTSPATGRKFGCWPAIMASLALWLPAIQDNNGRTAKQSSIHNFFHTHASGDARSQSKGAAHPMIAMQQCVNLEMID